MPLLSALWRAAYQLLRPHLRLLLMLGLGFVLPWFLVLKMAGEVWEKEGFWGDKAILEWLHAQASPAQDAVALWIAHVGGFAVTPIVEVLLALAMLLARQRRAAGYFLLAVVGSGLLNLVAKYLLARPRPDLWPSLTPLSSYSFPSGHAMAAATLAGALGFLLWHTRARWPALGLGVAWALVVGWSRMYLGVHYPSDVLAGWLGAIGWVGGVHLLYAHYSRGLRRLWADVSLYWHGQPAAALDRHQGSTAASAGPEPPAYSLRKQQPMP